MKLYERYLNGDYYMNLLKARKNMGLTQHEAAERIGCTLVAYGKYERSEREPSIELLKKMSKVFNASVDYLIGNTDDIKQLELPKHEKELLEAARSSDERAVEDAIKLLKGHIN